MSLAAGARLGPYEIVALPLGPARWAWALAGAPGLAAAVAAGVLYARSGPAVAEPTRFVVTLPPQLRRMDWPKLSQDTLLARPFSTRTLAFAGEPVPVAENATTPLAGRGFASFSASGTGTLAYLPQEAP